MLSSAERANITPGLVIRPIEVSDNQAIKQFMECYADGGKLKVGVRVKVEDVVRARKLIQPNNQGLVAFLPGVAFPVGLVYGLAKRITFGQSEQLVQAVLINGLAVHPQYRRQGIASALVREIIKWARANFGPEQILIYAFIQSGNTASQATFAKLGAHFTGRYSIGVPVKTRTARRLRAWPREANQIREAVPADYQDIASGLNQFYKGHDLYKPYSTASVADWLICRQLEGPPVKLANYYICANSQGEVQAGMGILNSSIIFEPILIEKPLSFSLINKVLKLVPDDGAIKTREMVGIWCKEGHWPALQQLFQAVIHLESVHTPQLTLEFDPQGALRNLVGWSILKPKFKSQLVLLNPPCEGLIGFTRPLA